MDKKKAQERIIELRKQVEYHSKRYYDEDNPEISDYEYDMLMKELKELEKEFPELITKDSMTQKVGGHVKEGFARSNTRSSFAKFTRCFFNRRIARV